MPHITNNKPQDRPCSRCGREYVAGKFRILKSGRRDSWCKQCHRDDSNQKRAADVEAARKKEAEYRAANREYFNAAQRKWTRNNPDKVREINQKQYARPGTKEAIVAGNSRRDKERKATDPEYKLAQVLKRHFHQSLKKRVDREERLRLTGCSLWFLKEWLSAQFRVGMTWQNHGIVWHIDHKRPRASFNMLDPKDRHDCWHYSNLQPLFANENLRKGKKLCL